MSNRSNTTNLLRSGDPRAFDRLYGELGPCVLGYLLRLTGGSRAEAEDLVQETFLAAYAGRANFHGRSQPLAWLLGIAHRRWRDGRRGKPPPVSLPDAFDTAAPGVMLAERVADAATLERALLALSDAERAALLLVVVQGLTYREAAEVTGEPIGTVKWRVHEATRTLRRLLSDAYEEQHGNEHQITEPARATA